MSAKFEVVSDHEVVFTRLLKASPELVWQAWTDPAHLHEWWGPDGYTTETHEFDFVPGGEWRFGMRAPNGEVNPNRIVFREIDAPRRLVYDNTWGLADSPLDFRVVVKVVPKGDATELWLHLIFKDAASLKVAMERYGVIAGGQETLERLATFLE